MSSKFFFNLNKILFIKKFYIKKIFIKLYVFYKKINKNTK